MGVRLENRYQGRKQSNYKLTLTGPTTTTKNETHEISVTVTSHPGIARDWLYSVLHSHRSHRHRLVVGLGLQWTSHEHSFYHHPLATLQLCIGRRCLIFHLYRAQSSPRILRRLLSDPRATFVGFWNSQDASKLMESRHELVVQRGMPIDLRHHVEDDNGRSLNQASIALIAEEVLGVDVEWSQAVSRSDWEDEELSFGQVQQAAVKAFVAFAVGMRVRAWDLNPNL